MAICGPKLSLCCTILSVWGIIQLMLMGAFFYTHSFALSEDLPDFKEHNITSNTELLRHVEEAYGQNARNCWLAAGCYVASLLFSLSQVYLNKRSSYQV